ncbi:hypothetical protein RQ698_11025 [Pseudomonas aeruginosa]|uniref:hypothetical protein n=1 Tax=Pseudomonas aeruginosa TaxID=287 RepID=UPI0028CD30A6|nr:hypothetical protein [Pseudomonas aeruginosa]MDT8245444.1 hypothetical protein [Pseudomonas aeruginosa]
MRITLSPVFVLPGESIAMDLAVYGDAVHLNGEVYDFSPLPDGGELPAGAIPGEIFFGVISRQGREIVMTVRLPVDETSTEVALYPDPIHVTEDGPVELPR